jgi:hypothetical protein
MSGREREFWRRYARKAKRERRKHRLSTFRRIRSGDMPEGAW